MKETYLRIRCRIPAELEDELPELLSPWPILGSAIDDATHEGVTANIFLSGADERCAEFVQQALKAHGARGIERSLVEADDWLAGFRDRVRPFAVGERWWIDPHPDRPTSAPEGRQRLAVEPRMAFGAGTHESTQAILIALEQLEVADRRVLDVGTGSGILALAADGLGADWVVALDIDPSALWVAVEIASQQERDSRLAFVLGPIDCLLGAGFDIVLCNMVASNFLPLANDLRCLLSANGVAVFAGLLASETDAVSAALAETGFEIISRRLDGEWASLMAAVATAL